MRISDWSSDVCSSDLAEILILALSEGVQFVLRRAFAHHGGDGLALAVAQQHDGDAAADGLGSDDGREILVRRHFLAGDADDYVARLDPGLVRALARLHALDEFAAILGEAESIGRILAQRSEGRTSE